MTPEERNVIGGIFDRLREAANQPRDPEAERFIADRIREQPYAPYAMAQSIFVTEQALGNMSQQVEQLQAEVARLRQSAQAAPAQSGGFLSSIFGGGSSQPTRPTGPSFSQPQGGGYAPPPQQSPWGQPARQGYAPPPQQGGYAPQQGGYAPAQAAAPQRGGMGFLGTAAMTAAGVAGGMIAGNALMNAFNSHGGTSGIANSLGFGDSKSDQSAALSDQSGGSNGYDNAGYEDPSGASSDTNYDTASYEDEGGGGFGGGGDSSDWT